MDTTSDGSSQRGNQANTNDNANTSKSYASVLNQQQSPKKDQAIVFNSVEGSKLLDYILAVGPLVGPKNIIFSSRISNNRICIYLNNKTVVEKFINESRPIKINNEILYGRRLVTPSERLVLSNVCPTIPNIILQENLQNLGLNLLSSISYIRINIPDPEYSHILSFRRQVFISPTEDIIPESILITHEDTQYRIFLSTDSICFKCKQSGHIASKCPPLFTNTATEDPLNINQVSSQPLSTQHSPSIQNTPETPLSGESSTSSLPSLSLTQNVPKNIAETNPTPKRNFKEIVTPPAEQNRTENLITFAKPNPTIKKAKHTSDTGKNVLNLEKSFEPAKPTIESHSPPFILTYDQLTDLFSNICGSANPINVALEYTTDLPALNYMIEKIYPLLTDRSIKTRCTKFRKKIRNHIDGLTSGTESDASQDLTY